jgi:arginine decarboxylase
MSNAPCGCTCTTGSHTKGDTVREVLDYVEFEPSDLITRLQTAVENAVRENRLNHQEAGRFLKFYEDGLNGYTYLEEPGD